MCVLQTFVSYFWNSHLFYTCLLVSLSLSLSPLFLPYLSLGVFLLSMRLFCGLFAGTNQFTGGLCSALHTFQLISPCRSHSPVLSTYLSSGIPPSVRTSATLLAYSLPHLQYCLVYLFCLYSSPFHSFSLHPSQYLSVFLTLSLFYITLRISLSILHLSTSLTLSSYITHYSFLDIIITISLSIPLTISLPISLYISLYIILYVSNYITLGITPS